MIDITQDEITKNWKGDFSKPLVSIKCATYNQEKYISKTIEGFLIQKTTFPFEVIVHDDASTDNTANIIREYEKKYPKIIKPIYETENQYSKHDGSLSRIMNAVSKGKYIAICEGDDYWIDENKLENQVLFLEKNSEYGLCYSKSKCYIQNENKFSKKIIGDEVKDFEDLLLNGNKIPTLTTVYRKKLHDDYVQKINPYNKNWKMGDYPMWLYFSHESKIHYSNNVTTCYRILENSASHSSNIEKKIEFEKNVYEIRKYFSEMYNIEIEDYDENKLLFYLYYSELLRNYRKEIQTKMNSCFLGITNKTRKIRVINFFSKKYFLFTFFLFFHKWKI